MVRVPTSNPASVAAIAVWWGWVITAESIGIGRVSTTMLATPLWMTEIAIPLGAGLLLLQSLAELIRLLRDGRSGSAPDETS